MFLRRYDWFRHRSLTHCLAGVEWWVNNQHRSHRERIDDLARGMKRKPRLRIDRDIGNPAHYQVQSTMGLDGRQTPSPGRRPAGPARLWLPEAGDSFPDLRFQQEIPDARAAEAWFKKAWGHKGQLPTCPRCGWYSRVLPNGKSSTMPYRCRNCGKPFSLKIGTVMFRSHLSLRQWLHALLIWTGGDGPATADELERRMGSGDGTGDDVNRAILKAATEDPDDPGLEPHPTLAEDCGLWWFRLGHPYRDGSGKPVHLVILEGSETKRVIVGRVEQSPGRSREEARRFAFRQMLQSGGYRVFWGVSGAGGTRDGSIHVDMEDESWQSHFQQIEAQVQAIFRDVYRDVSDDHLGEYLAGVQWWLNYGHLGHGERMRKLAAGMRYKDRPTTRSTRKRKARAPSPRHELERAAGDC